MSPENKASEARIADLERQNQRLREALEQYADKKNWRLSTQHSDVGSGYFCKLPRPWQVAEAALADQNKADQENGRVDCDDPGCFNPEHRNSVRAKLPLRDHPTLSADMIAAEAEESLVEWADKQGDRLRTAGWLSPDEAAELRREVRDLRSMYQCRKCTKVRHIIFCELCFEAAQAERDEQRARADKAEKDAIMVSHEVGEIERERDAAQQRAAAMREALGRARQALVFALDMADSETLSSDAGRGWVRAERLVPVRREVARVHSLRMEVDSGRCECLECSQCLARAALAQLDALLRDAGVTP